MVKQVNLVSYWHIIEGKKLVKVRENAPWPWPLRSVKKDWFLV